MKLLPNLLLFLLIHSAYSQTHLSPIQVDREQETLFKLQDYRGYYSGFWTMNDGLGNMSIKLGINGDGKYTRTGDGAAEILWTAHSNHGALSLNAGQKGTVGTGVKYTIGLMVDGSNNVISVGAANNSTGMNSGKGYKIADAMGILYADQIEARSSAGLSLNLLNSGGDIDIYDANEIQYILGDDASGDSEGIVLRSLTNPANGDALFKVESAGYSERLRVEHNGALSTTNYLEVLNTSNKTNNIQGDIYFNDKMAIGTMTFESGYHLTVEGKAIMEELKIKVVGVPDYVFSEDYELSTLGEIASYINENSHLPEIPSASEIEANGVNVGKLNMLLLKKIEELTLHLIDKDQQLDAILDRLDALEKK